MLLERSVFAVYFSNAFSYGNEPFPEDNSYNAIFPLLVILHVPHSKYRGVKICFHLCCTGVVRVALVLHSCHSFLTCVALVSLLSHSCCIRFARVALVLLVSGTRVVNYTRLLFTTAQRSSST